MRHSAKLIVLFVTASGTAHAATGDPLLSYPSSFASPDGLMWDGKLLWATDCSTTRIDKVDPASGDVVSSIEVAGVNSDEMTWDGTSLWASDHTATEMPNMGAPPPRLYRVSASSLEILAVLEAPGQSKYPMGLGWDGNALWSVDTWDKRIYELNPTTGEVLRSIPSPASGSCGMTWDGACLWLTDASTNGLVYHIDPASGEVLRSFDGPGGNGHQSTGIAWDGQHLWVHDEAKGRAAIYQLEVEDITESGRCAGALVVAPELDAGSTAPDAGDLGLQPEAVTESAPDRSACSVALGRASQRAPFGGLAALVVLLGGWRRRARPVGKWS